MGISELLRAYKTGYIESKYDMKRNCKVDDCNFSSGVLLDSPDSVSFGEINKFTRGEVLFYIMGTVSYIPATIELMRWAGERRT